MGHDFTSACLRQVVKPLVRQVQSEEAVSVIDDSPSHKLHTEEGEPVAWHYDHTTGTSAKGINFLIMPYYAGSGADGVSLPVDFARFAPYGPGLTLVDPNGV